MRKIVYILLMFTLSVGSISAQTISIKSNLLYGAYTHTPNIGVEIGLGKRSTLDIGGGYNPWNLNTSKGENRKLVHWLGQVEYRYWLCQKFSGHFLGIHAIGTEFNISKHEMPLLFERGSKNYRYEGFGYGGGLSYGYHFFLGKRLNLEANFGLGYARLSYDQYDYKKCGKLLKREDKNYIGPTKIGISLIYILK